ETVTSLDTARLKRDLRERLQDVRGLLGRHPTQARQMLRKLLVGKIAMEPVVEPDRMGYRLTGRLSYGRILQDEVLQDLPAVAAAGNSRSVVSPRGFGRFTALPERLGTAVFRGILWPKAA